MLSFAPGVKVYLACKPVDSKRVAEAILADAGFGVVAMLHG